ncbi:unnamed protein product [Blepharisma stoltei]|uniref:Vacuolar protein sorting-associated protein n=1 Tax=Blepharisma stoltei TaxID=1481888 RepID=A0AAU9JMF5_9CILI|nr:unnamed protein product [Blepharisma stoltei]
MNGAIANVLNKVLGDITENLNPEQLKISVFNGEMSLENLKLKSEAIKTLGLPFELKYGYIGKLHATIPWTSLTSSPLKIEISDVFILLTPRPSSDWNEDLEKEMVMSSKNKSIENFEVLNSSELSVNSDPGFTEKLVTKILDNLQITINSVYIRYEDSSSSISNFAIGLAIKSAQAITTNSQWNKEFVTDSAITYKLALLEDIRFFIDHGDSLIKSDEVGGFDSLARLEMSSPLNHRFILSPSNFRLEMVMNKNPKDLTMPQVLANLYNTEINIGIETNQLTHLFKLVDFMTLYTNFRNGVVTSFIEIPFTNEEASAYRDIYKQWKIYSKGKDQNKINGLQNQLEKWEKGYKLDSILKNRDAVNKELEIIRREEAVKQEIEKLETENKGGRLSAFTGYFWGKKEADKKLEEEEKQRKRKIIDEQLKQILHEKEKFASDVDQFIANAEVFANLPSTYSRFIVKLRVDLTKITIKDSEKEFLVLLVNNFSVETGIRPSSSYVKIYVKNTILEDRIVKSQAFPYLMFNEFLNINFDQLPQPKLIIESGGSNIVLNIRSFLAVSDAFSSAIAQKVDFNKYLKAASDKTNEYIIMGQNYIGELVKTGAKATIELDISMKAPAIFIPLDIYSLDEGILVVDLGNFKGNSSIQQIDDTDYDKYHFSLEDSKIAVIKHCDSLVSWRSGSFQDFLPSHNLNLDLFNCKNKQENVPGFILEAKFSAMHFDLDESLLLFSLKLKDSLLELLPKSPPEPKIEVPAINSENMLDEALKDKMKRIDNIIGVLAKAEVEGISLKLRRGSSELGMLNINSLKMGVQLNKNGDVIGNLSLERIEMRDLRDGIEIREIIYNPIKFVKADEDEFVDAVEEIIQISVKFTLKPREDSLELSLSLSDLRIMATPDYIEDIMKFFSYQLHEASVYHQEKIDTMVNSHYTTAFNTKLSAEMSNFELWVPIDPRNHHKRIGCFHFGLSIIYNSSQEYTSYFNSKNEIIKKDFISINDEATIEITHIGGLVGLIHKSQIHLTEERSQDLLKPSRISMNYFCTKMKDRETQIKILVNLESLWLDIGFRDLQFFKALAENWKNFKPAEAVEDEEILLEEIHTVETNMDIFIECDSFQIRMLDDTGLKAYSLLHLHLSNFSSKINLKGPYLDVNLSAFIFADYYNLEIAVWEPLLEEWDFELNGKRETADSVMLIEFVSSRIFNINLTLHNLEMLGTLITKLSQDSSFWNEEAIRQSLTDNSQEASYGNFMYVLHNNLGETANIWLDVPETTEKWLINPNQSIGFGQKLIDKLFMGSQSIKHGIMEDFQPPASISLEIEGYQPASGIIIERVGIRGFSLKGRDSELSCLISVKAVDNEKHIYIQSATEFVNYTSEIVNLEYSGEILAVQGNSSLPLPLKWSKEIGGYPLISTQSEQKPVIEEGCIQLNESSWAILEIDHYKTETDIDQRLIQLKPPYVFSNFLPCPINVFFNHIDFPAGTVNPGEYFSTLNIDPRREDNIQKIQLNIDHKFTLETEWSSLCDFQYTQALLQGNFSGNSITLDQSHNTEKKSQIINLSERKIVKNEIKRVNESKLIDIYSEYCIVNQSNYYLDCGIGEMRINPHSIGFFDDKTYLKIKAAEDELGPTSSWSKDFNIDAVGVSGLITLDNSQARQLDPKAPEVILLGVRVIDAPPPLIKSRIVYITPRFMINNYLGYEIYIRQVSDSSENIKTLESSASLQYQLDSANDSKLIQISRNGVHWSSPFNIQQIEDFHIKIQAKEEEKSEIQQDWFRPSAQNNFMHFIRVIVSTEDESCIHISLVTPLEPEFRICNYTEQEITAYQIGYSHLVIPPGECAPWAFDNLCNENVIQVALGTAIKGYSLENIEKLGDLGQFSAEVFINGVTRELHISPPEPKLRRQQTISKKKMQGFKFIISLAGAGISVIDNNPSEMYYLSLQYLRLKFVSKQKFVEDGIENLLKFDLSLKSLQLDNMQAIDDMYPVIFSPKKLPADDDPPFIQAKIHKSRITRTENEQEISSIEKYSWLEILVQEMQFQLNYEILVTLASHLKVLQDKLGVKPDYKKKDHQLTILELCPLLDASDPKLKANPSQVSKKNYFQFIRLCAMKIYVSFKISAKHIELDPGLAFGIFRAIASISLWLVNTTDTPLYFKELLVENSFQTISDLSKLVISNYIRQGIFQFYNLIGSIDILGNPIGLIDKLGTGVFEFLNEPAKGALKGPKAFAHGIEKGIRSLVGNVISGGFGSVSKVTGKLYGIVREVGGDNKAAERINDSDNAILDIYGGVKGGVKDLAEGITGIFTKPISGAKEAGASGFLKGIGSGIIGAFSAPVSAALRLGVGIASGMTSAGTLIAQGKVNPRGRARFPRYFNMRKVLEPYNNETAQAQDLIKNIPEFSKEQIVFYLHLAEKEDIIVILTLDHLLVLINAELAKFVSIGDISSLEIHRTGAKFTLCAGNPENQIVLNSSSFSSLAKLYSAISSLPSFKASEPNIKKIAFKKGYRSSFLRNHN